MAKLCFIYFLLFVVYCTLNCFADPAISQEPAGNSSELFKGNAITPVKSKPNKADDKTKQQITLSEIKTFSLVAIKEFMVALVEAEIETVKNVNILAKYIKTKQQNWGGEAIKTNDDNYWKTQLVTDKKSPNENFSTVMTSVANVKKNEIYVFAVNCTSATKTNSECSNYENVNITMFAGSISIDPQPSENKFITWEEKLSLKLSKISGFEKDLNDKLILPITDASAFVTKDNKVVLFLISKTKDGKNKSVIALNYEENDSVSKLEFLSVDVIDVNCNPHLFQWRNKIIMIPFCQSGSSQKIKEMTNLKEWGDAVEPFSRLWTLFKDKRDFTSAKINDREVLLFTQQKNDKAPATGEKGFNLFISDGTRMKQIGFVASDVSDTDPIKLLFTDNEFFSLHRKSTDKDHSSIILTRHETFLEKIKTVIDAWKTTDDVIKTQCTNLFTEDSLCSDNFFIDGLVGFLSNNASGSNNKVWHDEYYYVNAAIENGEKIENGFKFNNRGAGAMWLVSKPEPSTEMYKFVLSGFTLLATASFDINAKWDEPNSVLGVVFKKADDDGAKHVRLWCSKEKKWSVSGKEITPMRETGKKCIQGGTYIIAFVLSEDKNLEIYVNGNKLTNLDSAAMRIEPSQNIEHFYFGAEKADGATVESCVSITNVMLYNRLFASDKIEKLKLKQNNDVATQQSTQLENGQTQQPKESTTQTATQPDPSTTDKQEKAQSSPPPTTEDGAARVGVVLYVVWCVHIVGALCVLTPPPQYFIYL